MFTDESFNNKGFSAEYEVVQIFPNGYEQHISIADTLDEAKKDIEEFPHKWRHLGRLEIKKRAESHAYSYAYNEGHSDSRKDDGYNPIKSKQDLVDFKRILKQKAESYDFSQKSAESFSADWQTNDKFWNMLYEEHEYLFDEDGMVDYPMEQLAEIAKDMGFDAESNYPKGEKGYVIYSLGYNEGEQGKGRKSPESFVSMIAKFNDTENSHMLSDDDDSYTIYTIGYFDGESDKINKRTPQAFELMLSKMGKSYGKPLLSSIPKTARLDAESKKNCGCGQDPCKTYGAETSYCHNHKTCGGYRVQGTFLCWPCHDIEADIRIAKRNDAESKKNCGCGQDPCKTYGAENSNKVGFSQKGFWKTKQPDYNLMPRWGEKLTRKERKKREKEAMENGTELDFPYVDASTVIMITKIVDGEPMRGGSSNVSMPRLELPDTMTMTWGEIKALGKEQRTGKNWLGKYEYGNHIRR